MPVSQYQIGCGAKRGGNKKAPSKPKPKPKPPKKKKCNGKCK